MAAEKHLPVWLKAAGAVGLVVLGGLVTWYLGRGDRPDLTATIRHGRRAPDSPTGKEAGCFDISIANNGSKTAKAVKLDVPGAIKAWACDWAGKKDAWIDPINGRFDLGDITSSDRFSLLVLVPTPPGTSAAESIKLAQDEGGSSMVVMEWSKGESFLRTVLKWALNTVLVFALFTPVVVFYLRRMGNRQASVVMHGVQALQSVVEPIARTLTEREDRFERYRLESPDKPTLEEMVRRLEQMRLEESNRNLEERKRGGREGPLL